MGNSTSTVYTKGTIVPTKQQTIRQLFTGQYDEVDGEISILSYTTDASVSPVVPEITRSVIEKVSGSRQLEGTIPIMRSELTSTGLDLIVPRIKPLELIESEKDENLLGIYFIGRTLHLMHSIHRLSHNNVCLASIFRHYTTGTWLLTEDLAGDLKNDNFTLVSRATALLEPASVPPEFTGARALPNPASYPIHARDSFAFAVFVKKMLEDLQLPCPPSARAILTEMTHEDFAKRPMIDRLLKDTLFMSNSAVKIVSRLMDLRHGLLDSQAAQTLFQELPIVLSSLLTKKSTFRPIMDQVTKYSVLVHPAALSTKFLLHLFTARAANKPSSETSAITGILSLADYKSILLPFLEECWTLERPGLATVLLKLLGRYIYKLDPKFVRDVVVKRVLSLNILVEQSLAPAFITAYPMLLKHHLKKNFDVSPLTRHLVKQTALFVSDDVLRTKALTCLLVHPKIPSLLLKEYLNRGLSDQSPQVRLDVVRAVSKFAITFADNDGPMSAKCLADAVMGSLLLSMVDVDASVRTKARNTIRKLTFVMERKEAQIVANYTHLPTSPTVLRHTTDSPSHKTPTKANQQKPLIKTSPSAKLAPNAQKPHSTATEPNFDEDADQDTWDNDPSSSSAPPAVASPISTGWSTWNEWEDDDDTFDDSDWDAPKTNVSKETSSQLVSSASHSSVPIESVAKEVGNLEEGTDIAGTGLLKSPSHHSQQLDMAVSDDVVDAWGNDDEIDFSSVPSTNPVEALPEVIQTTPISSALLAPAPSSTTETTATDSNEVGDWGNDDDFGDSEPHPPKEETIISDVPAVNAHQLAMDTPSDEIGDWGDDNFEESSESLSEANIVPSQAQSDETILSETAADTVEENKKSTEGSQSDDKDVSDSVSDEAFNESPIAGNEPLSLTSADTKSSQTLTHELEVAEEIGETPEPKNSENERHDNQEPIPVSSKLTMASWDGDDEWNDDSF